MGHVLFLRCLNGGVTARLSVLVTVATSYKYDSEAVRLKKESCFVFLAYGTLEVADGYSPSGMQFGWLLGQKPRCERSSERQWRTTSMWLRGDSFSPYNISVWWKH